MKSKYWFVMSSLILVSIILAGAINGRATLAQEEGNSTVIEIRPSTITDTMNAFLADKQPPQDLKSASLTPCVGGTAAGYPCNNIDLLAFMPLSAIGGGSGNDIWGWTDSTTGKEYAIMGRTTGTSFVDISDPINPIYLGNLPRHQFNSSWRDIKVYNNHAFIVSEATNSGIQVFDLTQLQNVTSPPVTFAETAYYNGLSTAHNIVINEDSGYAYAVGANTCSGGLDMINIQNPTSPISTGCFSSDGYTHDAQCVIYLGPDATHQGKEICMNSNEDTLTIVDVTNKSALLPNYPALATQAANTRIKVGLQKIRLTS